MRKLERVKKKLQRYVSSLALTLCGGHTLTVKEISLQHTQSDSLPSIAHTAHQQLPSIAHTAHQQLKSKSRLDKEISHQT